MRPILRYLAFTFHQQYDNCTDWEFDAPNGCTVRVTLNADTGAYYLTQTCYCGQRLFGDCDCKPEAA